MKSKTIVLADDHPMFRAGVRQVIVNLKQYTVVEEVGDGHAAVTAIKRHNPEFALLDLSMPGLNGFDVISTCSGIPGVQTRYIIISMFSSVGYRERARELGAFAFIAKEDAISELKKALHSGTEFFTSQSVGSEVGSLHGVPVAPNEFSVLDKLTSAEKRVLLLIADGKTSKQAARELGISPRTVDAHRRNCAEKLEVQGRHALIQVAIKYQSHLLNHLDS